MKLFRLLGLEISLLLLTQGLQAATVSLTVDEEMNFSPNVLTVQQGDVVEFVNNDTYGHSIVADPKLVENPANVSLPEGAEPFHSELLKKGEKYSFTLSVPGTYNYVCGKHEKMGMKGQIVVVPKSEEQIVNASVIRPFTCEIRYRVDQAFKKLNVKSELTPDSIPAIYRNIELEDRKINLIIYINDTNHGSISVSGVDSRGITRRFNGGGDIRPGGGFKLAFDPRDILPKSPFMGVRCTQEK